MPKVGVIGSGTMGNGIAQVFAQNGWDVALVDVAHWASEAPWLDEVAHRLRSQFGTTVEVRVSRRVTDPWTLHIPSPESSQKRP